MLSQENCEGGFIPALRVIAAENVSTLPRHETAGEVAFLSAPRLR